MAPSRYTAGVHIRDHHQRAIDRLADAYRDDPRFRAVIIGGSVARGYARADSDVDFLIVATDEEFERRLAARDLFINRTDLCDYEGGFVDGKIIDLAFLEDLARLNVETPDIMPRATDHIDDMVAAYDLAAAAPAEAIGRAYLIVGPRPVTVRELVESCARVLQVRPPALRLPRGLALALGWAVSLVLAFSTWAGPAGWQAFAVNALIMGAIPVLFTRSFLYVCQRWLPHNFFIYVFVNAFFTGGVAAVLSAAGAHSVPVLVDPKRRDLTAYRGANVVTPNLRELEEATGRDGARCLAGTELASGLTD